MSTGTEPETADGLETLEAFGRRAAAWLRDHMPPAAPGYAEAQLDSDGRAARELQRRLFEGGFAGLCFPRSYGGQGLTPAHQRVFTAESVGYQMPILFNVPTLTIIAPTLLEFGTEEQKRRYIPAMLRGDELWVQLLSEPVGGSDLAGLVTHGRPDGDEYVINGSKVWSSGAFRSDYGLCLVRTDWDVPKHDGLSMFILPLDAPGVEIRQIEMINKSRDFCEEFFTDVRVPRAHLVGELCEGWRVTRRLLDHERDAVGGASIYESGVQPARRAAGCRELIELARHRGVAHTERTRSLIGEARVNQIAQNCLIEHVTARLADGTLPPTAGAFLRLAAANTAARFDDIGLELAGGLAAGWPVGSEHGAWPHRYLFRQANALKGGSSEMQRNIISERVLGLPREAAPDRGVPFRAVRRSATATPTDGAQP
ncbi:MAG TPA: acyl-CoA dehydrogenase family protein [Ilumatobacter sp.]|nr:acyl-CoA dehydrogenase family protein [Ilumatobacter sp.]